MSDVARSRRDPRIMVLVAVHVGLAVLALSRASATDDSDIRRFTEIATAAGTPWRDHGVEYAPGETAILVSLPVATTAEMARVVVALALAADLAIASFLARGWGPRASTVYLLAVLPLLIFLFYRLDLVVVAVVVLGTLLVRRRARAGGAVLGLAVLLKVWPIVAVPLLVRGRRPAIVAVVLTVLAGGVAWLVWGGIDALGQVVGFRGATGWSVESVAGSIVWILTGGPVAIEAGAPRTGVASLPWRLLLLALLIGLAVWTYRLARGWRGDVFGVPTLTVLGALLVTSPLFSLQYACWLTPSIAVAWDDPRDRPTAIAGAVAVALTGVVFLVVQGTGGGLATRSTVLGRNASVVAMTVIGLRSLVRSARAA